jgi:hypothetical protein
MHVRLYSTYNCCVHVALCYAPSAALYLSLRAVTVTCNTEKRSHWSELIKVMVREEKDGDGRSMALAGMGG